LRCSKCGTENEAGRKFCLECGTPLARACAVCGTSNPPAAKFCGECGSPLAGLADATEAAVQATAERRLVSVLFADLVGFTSISEARDAEEVRDLLTRYFDTARSIVGRYGGTIEKFIGDAVMAVWGTPVANEDDAERAVRAALDLVAAVDALGQEAGAAGLKARAGVLTGEAAVTLGATGQGMVAGDLVNTAARIQSAAEPGTVLVGESTREATDASVVYEPAGLHELKGKAEPLALFRALRVVALVGGALKSQGLEAPFVGRDAEFRLVKELFHASAEGRKANLVSVTGIAGIGKSRLSWEFFKYIDGLAQPVWWHRGRCLPYGEGVTYWALAEMVRGRADVAEGEDPDAAAEKLHALVAEHVSDPEELRWVEPRLAHLLGLEDREARQPEELFSAWRLFFERLSAQAPVAIVFEDLQWADSGLLDFIEYLLEWSRNHPIFVMTLARPELSDRRPAWGAGKRNFTSLALEPLSEEAMRALLDGLVPGLPGPVQQAVLDRAQGVPLYAVETVRMLIDRGLLVQEGAGYRPTGPIEVLEVPQSLHALIAARLDGLAPEERRLVQHASVLGKTFSTEALAALTGAAEGDAEALLLGLCRKEVLGLQADPRSPERGQYGFLQDLVKRVAYETLSKRDRKALHLAAAHHLETAWGGDEGDIVEIVAFHYLEAYQALPDASDASELRGAAREALVRAGERAASLASKSDAQTYFDRAFELADEAADQARISELAGVMAEEGNRQEEAAARFERAIDLYRSAGLTHDAARASARLGETLWFQVGQIDRAIELMDTSLATLAEEEPDEAIATLMHQAARLHYFRGQLAEATEWVERSLEVAEAEEYWAVLSQSLNTKSLILGTRRRHHEAAALLRHALAIAEEHQLPEAMMRALFNMANDAQVWERWDEAVALDLRHEEMAVRLGDRTDEALSRVHLVIDFAAMGRWDDAVAILDSLPPQSTDEPESYKILRSTAVPVLVGRGRLDEAERAIAGMTHYAGSNDAQDIRHYNEERARLLQARGRFEEGLAAAELSLSATSSLGIDVMAAPFQTAMECAMELGRLDRVQDLLDALDRARPGELPPSARAVSARFHARLAALGGDHDAADRLFQTSIELMRQSGQPFLVATVLMDRAESLLAVDRRAEAASVLSEGRAILERLEARPALERLEALAAQVVPAGAASA
jgi:predicted ATPase/class 3 adenylate cyclase